MVKSKPILTYICVVYWFNIAIRLIIILDLSNSHGPPPSDIYG